MREVWLPGETAPDVEAADDRLRLTAGPFHLDLAVPGAAVANARFSKKRQVLSLVRQAE